MKLKFLMNLFFGFALMGCGGKDNKPASAHDFHPFAEYDGTWKFNLVKTRQEGNSLLQYALMEGLRPSTSRDQPPPSQEEIMTIAHFRQLLMGDYVQIYSSKQRVTSFEAAEDVDQPELLLGTGTTGRASPFIPTDFQIARYRPGTLINQVRAGTADSLMDISRNYTQLARDSENQFRNRLTGGEHLRASIQFTLNPQNHHELTVSLVSCQFRNGQTIPDITFYYDRVQPIDHARFPNIGP